MLLADYNNRYKSRIFKCLYLDLLTKINDNKKDWLQKVVLLLSIWFVAWLFFHIIYITSCDQLNDHKIDILSYFYHLLSKSNVNCKKGWVKSKRKFSAGSSESNFNLCKVNIIQDLCSLSRLTQILG